MDEWIEIENISSKPLLLEDLILRDERGESVLPTTPIDPYSFLVYEKPSDFSISFNNSGETISLVDPAGDVLDTVSYGQSTEGSSFARIHDVFITAQPTPGQPNTTTSTPNQPTSKQNKSERVSQQVPPPLPTGLQSVTGTLTVEPFVFGKTTVYIQDEAKGYQVYFSKGDWPPLFRGTTLNVTGVASSIDGEPRIKIAARDDLTYTESAPPTTLPAPDILPISDITDALLGRLIRISGEVVDVSYPTLFVGDETGEIRVYFKSTKITDKPLLGEGDGVSLTGILSKTALGYRILPRYPEDIVLEEKGVLGVSDTPQHKHYRTLIAVLLCILLIGLVGITQKNRISAYYTEWKIRRRPLDDVFEE